MALGNVQFVTLGSDKNHFRDDNFVIMSLKGIFPIDKWDFNSQSILDKLPAEEFERLLQNAVEKTYVKGEMIFREGAYAGGIFYIKEGKVKKYKVDNFGKEQIIYVANPGELIGYHAILAAEPYPDSAAVLEAGIITFIPKEDFLEVLDQSLVLSKRLLKTLSHEFAVLTNSISVFTQRPVRERLAITLLILREKYKVTNAPNSRVEINVSRDDIANMAGATRENVVRLLREFKDEKLIETKGRKIWILDIKRLAAASNYM
jgi:CRP-like cAMP-binding protein